MHAVLFSKERNRSRTHAELRDDFQLPPAMVNFYSARAPFLLQFGKLRNAIVHRGQEAGPVLIAERGFVILVGGQLYELAKEIWRPEHHANTNAVSLKPLLSHVVMTALHACTEATGTYLKIVQCPPELMPGYQVFTRIHQVGALSRVQDVLTGGSPWWDGPDNAFDPETAAIPETR